MNAFEIALNTLKDQLKKALFDADWYMKHAKKAEMAAINLKESIAELENIKDK